MVIVQPCLYFQLRIIFRVEIGSVPEAFMFLLMELAPFAVCNIYHIQSTLGELLLPHSPMVFVMDPGTACDQSSLMVCNQQHALLAAELSHGHTLNCSFILQTPRFHNSILRAWTSQAAGLDHPCLCSGTASLKGSLKLQQLFTGGQCLVPGPGEHMLSH